MAQRSSAPNGRTGRPPVTSRAEILAAARRLIDRDGWEKLTVRRLAAELGTGPTTMYHHVRDKEALLLLLLNEYASQMPRPELPSDPRDRIVTATIAIHDALAEWPWAAEVLTANGFVGLFAASSLWPVETVIAATVETGRTLEEAVDVFRNIWFYTVGEILVQAHSPDRAVERDPFFTDLDPTQTPHLAAIGNDWPQLATHPNYAAGLRAIVNGLLP
ncbi:helix-turn-helix domain-containing protein [Kribbella sp. NPDC051952]|uniref:TetR/AcrR family transcriptional regulator n=1 Tax=Kribbella sp. NPDC051952 TaxID=3154851 RepID=UPI0034168FC2